VHARHRPQVLGLQTGHCACLVRKVYGVVIKFGSMSQRYSCPQKKITRVKSWNRRSSACGGIVSGPNGLVILVDIYRTTEVIMGVDNEFRIRDDRWER
jgi:hypothetical protein